MLYSQACHMGAQLPCIAKDIAENNRDARMLLVACEVNTIIFRGPDERDIQSLAGQAAFADGAAAVIVGADPIQGVEKPIFEIMSAAEVTVPESDMAVGGLLNRKEDSRSLAIVGTSAIFGCLEDIVSRTCAIMAYGSHGWKLPFAAKDLARVEEVEGEAEATESSAEEGFSTFMTAFSACGDEDA
ncbi:hypothetical protein MUK42_04379 [Musa troglodytarum]|uniref:Chalcone/stilbene synthase N-terminal domain-containing protein n=1 Tax=Musa troglodytarum TaxID=320322 RepID=A0A9E7K3S4_9LILI|nr:hypothetical protein MUK42_04379 [Musa troglodytarum]